MEFGVGRRGAMTETMATKAPCYGKLNSLPPATKPQSPLCFLHSQGTFLEHPGCRAASSSGPEKRRGDKKGNLQSLTGPWMLTRKPRRSVRGRGRAVCLGDVKQTARRPKGPQRSAGRRPGPTRSSVPEPLLSRPCAPRCPRLPRAEDAQALPVNEAAAPPRAE